jgi:hypothetical protein
MVSDNSLGVRALTRFNGIPFGLEHLYTYPEAKRLLRLLRAKIQKQKTLCKKLAIIPDVAGRTAIPDQGLVWDYFAIKGHPQGKNHTFYPHMTFAIEPKMASAYITVPNSVRRDILKTMRNASLMEFQEAVTIFLSIVARHFKKTGNVRPAMIIQQRRYPTQRSTPFLDARLNVDLRTASKVPRTGKKLNYPKFQPEWLQMAQAVIQQKASNLELQIGCEFDYEKCPAIRRPDSEMLFVNAWLAARVFFKNIHVDI